MNKATTRKIKLLLVEDSPLHQKLTQRALEATQLDITLDIVSDGVEAMDYLRRRLAAGSDGEQPDLILLDLNMPRMGGLEVLHEIKSDPVLHVIPIAVLTTSESPNDIRESYDRGANTYLTKPDGFHEFREMLKELGDFWLKRARLPRHGA
jgi:CheY-like chemotaxis protein